MFLGFTRVDDARSSHCECLRTAAIEEEGLKSDGGIICTMFRTGQVIFITEMYGVKRGRPLPRNGAQ